MADEFSCVRSIVNTSPDTFITRTISAFVLNGRTLGGQTVQLKGVGEGKNAPCPVATVNVVPDGAGNGAIATVEYAKFLWASIGVLVS